MSVSEKIKEVKNTINKDGYLKTSIVGNIISAVSNQLVHFVSAPGKKWTNVGLMGTSFASKLTATVSDMLSTSRASYSLMFDRKPKSMKQIIGKMNVIGLGSLAFVSNAIGLLTKIHHHTRGKWEYSFDRLFTEDFGGASYSSSSSSSSHKACTSYSFSCSHKGSGTGGFAQPQYNKSDDNEYGCESKLNLLTTACDGISILLSYQLSKAYHKSAAMDDAIINTNITSPNREKI